MNILIVDDRPIDSKLLRAQLQAESHRVVSAAHGIEALAILEHEKVDAIFSDVLMPKMDGYRFCCEVRKNPRLSPIPFIFYSATDVSPADEKLCLDLGGDKYLRKPSNVEIILAALDEAMNVAGRRRQLASLVEPDVMSEYNQRLVAKLAEQQLEMQKMIQRLQAANHENVQLKRNLERRVAERTMELEAANRELEAFSHSISHDLHAPLRAINGFVRMIKEDHAAKITDGINETLTFIGASATDMGRLIDGLLTFSRFTREPLNKVNVSAAALANHALEILASEVKGADPRVSIAGLPDVYGDPTLLQQVFVNLLSNAFKYSRHRNPPLIEVGFSVEQGKGVYFVRDNGAGFDMRHVGDLFGVFRRLHSSDQFEGAGVGLSIVQRIVRRHGGRIWAEGKVDEGATFYFTLPNSAE